MWWLYFRRDHAALFAGSVGRIFAVGYGHYLVFASVAATGAALAAAVDIVQGEAHASTRVVGLALAGAVALYLWCLTAMGARGGAPVSETRLGTALGVVILVIASLAPPIGVLVLLTGIVLSGAVAHHVLTSRDPVETVTAREAAF